MGTLKLDWLTYYTLLNPKAHLSDSVALDLGSIGAIGSIIMASRVFCISVRWHHKQKFRAKQTRKWPAQVLARVLRSMNVGQGGAE